MHRAIDLAAYITSKLDELGVMKLQRLAFYCQAWSLVWDEKQLFEDEIEAWCNGPVIPELFRMCDDRFVVDKCMFLDGDTECFDIDQKKTIDVVLDAYGSKSSQWLCDMVMSEEPWLKARSSDNKTFNLRDVVKYYRSIMNSVADKLKSGEFSRDKFDEKSRKEIHEKIVSEMLHTQCLQNADNEKFVYLNVGPETLRTEISAQVMGFSTMVPFTLVAAIKENQTYESVYAELKKNAFDMIQSKKKSLKM